MSVFVFTGRGVVNGDHLTRAEWEGVCRNFGHLHFDKVSHGVDYLVCENPRSGSMKMRTAHDLGVDVISYERFMEIMRREVGGPVQQVARPARTSNDVRVIPRLSTNGEPTVSEYRQRNIELARAHAARPVNITEPEQPKPKRPIKL